MHQYIKSNKQYLHAYNFIKIHGKCHTWTIKTANKTLIFCILCNVKSFRSI